MVLPSIEVDRAVIRQQVAERLKTPEYPLFFRGITKVPVALFTATSVYNTILGRHRSDGQTLGGTRVLDPASLKLPPDTNLSDISHLIKLTEAAPIGLGSAMNDKYAGLYFMYQLLRQSGYVGEAEVRAVRRAGGKTLLLVRNIDEFKALPPEEREVIFFQHAEHIADLHGLHTTAIDMNTTTRDMDYVWTRLSELGVPQYVACQSPEPPFNGTGDPSINTGLGVWSAALTTLDFLGIRADEVAFLVQGVGNVGGPQTEVMGETHPNITTIILDKEPGKIKVALENYRGHHIYVGDADDPFGEKTKKIAAGKPLVFMPTAREGEVNLKRLEQMVKAKVVVVCGAANNQFPFTSHYRPDLRVALDYEFAGITVVPDSGDNAGGIQHLEMVKLGMPEAIIGDLIVRGEQLFTQHLLERAQLAKEPPMVTYQKLVVDVITDYCLEHNITP